jgi:ubiquinone/menaquinone biosynthesis C-methylase UbiE
VSINLAESQVEMIAPTIDPRAARAAAEYLRVVRSIKDESLWALIMFANTNIFMWHIDSFARDFDPVPAFVEQFEQATRLLESAAKTGIVGGHFPVRTAAETPNAGEGYISTMFSDVWVALSDDVYFDETYNLIVQRFARNGVDAAALFKDKVVVDAGCGSGKFAAGIARLGAKKVIGLDIGERGLEFAREQAKKKNYGERLEYRYGSAHDLPLEDRSVDMVWSNGVIHLTDDYDGCVREFARVLKPDGTLYLYVNGRFSLFELLFDTLRMASEAIPRHLFQHYLLSIGINSGRVYWMMCAFYATYQWRARAEVEALLKKEGFEDIRQLTRGADFDQIEQVSVGVLFADVKYGEAQLKYLARRKVA